ncbi:MAG TPA: tRNA (adenosine(37)-N6)-dimethylallyltransferase MiaA [Candidatus Pseudogracilibacillus intestinigallinarum]|uniref:tRNA dimethylallyltransferase n=1 Tax=Candidatus Pseudogracilibacillus intestinigallinarum TaxID=2838742 RepID=A0A9D1PPD4_9BACI|nr:tRNA (adenosine(37)-N6)-dimethylallyltransferase MiaA [Candidatus Pseudogracilibacillus intestinigallinarum]
MEKEKVIVIVGPTAIGKTDLSIQLAKELQTEIISGDSMQVYKGMDIGTGKITKEEMADIPHYMLNIRQPNEDFSVATFKELVEEHIKVINEKGKIPIIVGGTGLYIQAVLFDYQFSEQKRDEKFTKELENLLEREGNIALHEKLKKVDPIQASKIHPNNYRRVIRALEVFESTGKTMTERHKTQNKTSKYDYVLIGLEMNRDKLYDRINRRVEKMVQDGLVEEVRALYDKGFSDTQAMKAIGYKEIIPYLEQEMSLDEAVSILQRNSRRYAKRQYTWFKNQMDVTWFDAEKVANPTYLKGILQYIENSVTKTK